MALSLSCRRFHVRYNPLLAFGGAGRGWRQAIFPEGLAGSWSSAAARNQRRRQPFLSEGRGGAEARAETGSPLPLSNLSLPEQQSGAGPSSDQTAGQSESRIPIPGWCVANDSGLRGRAYDSQGPSAEVTERGCGRAGSVCQRDPRLEGCISIPGSDAWPSTSPDYFCNTSFKTVLDKVVHIRNRISTRPA